MLSDVATGYWWLSVVVMGVLLNLVGGYAKDALDRFLAARSDRIRQRRQRDRIAFDAEVAKLAADPVLLVLAGQRHIAASLEFVGVLVFFSLMLVISAHLEASSGLAPMLRTGIQIVILLSFPFIALLIIVLMKRESDISAAVRSARLIYEQAMKSEPGEGGPLRGGHAESD